MTFQRSGHPKEGIFGDQTYPKEVHKEAERSWEAQVVSSSQRVGVSSGLSGLEGSTCPSTIQNWDVECWPDVYIVLRTIAHICIVYIYIRVNALPYIFIYICQCNPFRLWTKNSSTCSEARHPGARPGLEEFSKDRSITVFRADRSSVDDPRGSIFGPSRWFAPVNGKSLLSWTKTMENLNSLCWT